MDLSSKIRDIVDFPTKGILFKDITPLLKDTNAFKEAVGLLAEPYKDKAIDIVVGVEARGFIFAPIVADRLGAGFVPVRKPGKLPGETLEESYDLEYGTDMLQIHKDGVQEGDRVLLVDDLLATGGTAQATAKLVERLGGQVIGVTFLIELCFLNGKEKLEGYEVKSLIQYD